MGHDSIKKLFAPQAPNNRRILMSTKACDGVYVCVFVCAFQEGQFRLGTRRNIEDEVSRERRVEREKKSSTSGPFTNFAMNLLTQGLVTLNKLLGSLFL